jgi:polar amino acid transport system substrate-binding protein
MNMRMWSFSLSGWLSIFLTPSALQAETLRFATIDYCPFTCSPAKEKGKEGFMTDILREALEPAGYTLEITTLPYVRAVKSVQDGAYDGIVVVGKDYAPDLIYPDQPTVSQRTVFLVNAGTKWEYTGVDSLPQVRVGIVRGYHYVDDDLIAYLAREQQNETLVHVMHGDNTTGRGLQLLLSKRVTTFLEGEYSAIYELEKLGIRDQVVIAGHTRKAFEDYTGFSPHNPDAARYARILSDSLKELNRTGRIHEILLRYGITLEQKLDPLQSLSN